MFRLNLGCAFKIFLTIFTICWCDFTFAQSCRIEGYPFAIECVELAAQTDADLLLKIYRVPATVRYPRPEPIIWIPDSLVVKATEKAPSMIAALSRVRAHRDFIWVAFSGKQVADLLACNAQANLAHLNIVEIPQRIDPFYTQAQRDICQQKVNNIANPQAFSSDNIAALYEKVRQKLHLPQAVVVTEGRGAEIALAWQNLAPHAIQFAVLDNPLLPDEDFYFARATSQMQALQAVFDACGASEVCRQQFPDTRQDFLEIISQLPQKITLKDPLTMQAATFEMHDILFLQAMQFLLRSPSRAKTLPMLLSSAKRGDWQPFVGMLSVGWFKKNNEANLGLYLLESCKNFDNHQALQNHHLTGIAHWFFQTEQKRLQRLCGTQAVQKNVKKTVNKFSPPSLILTGDVNPMRQEIFSYFQNKTVISAKNAGAAMLGYGCTKDVIYRYFKKMDAAEITTYPIDAQTLEASCITEIPYPSMEHLGHTK